MKVYILKEQDFESLLALLDRDPEYGRSGGSSHPLTEKEREAHVQAHGFFNYQIRGWIAAMQRD